MKVTCKTLQGAAFHVECEPTETVAALKQKIQGANPTLLAEHAVTVFQGKVLQDASSLADAGVSETGFVVVMIKKPAAGARAARVRVPRVALPTRRKTQGLFGSPAAGIAPRRVAPASHTARQRRRRRARLRTRRLRVCGAAARAAHKQRCTLANKPLQLWCLSPFFRA
jgi:hypothetical protein